MKPSRFIQTLWWTLYLLDYARHKEDTGLLTAVESKTSGLHQRHNEEEYGRFIWTSGLKSQMNASYGWSWNPEKIVNNFTTALTVLLVTAYAKWWKRLWWQNLFYELCNAWWRVEGNDMPQFFQVLVWSDSAYLLTSYMIPSLEPPRASHDVSDNLFNGTVRSFGIYSIIKMSSEEILPLKTNTSNRQWYLTGLSSSVWIAKKS